MIFKILSGKDINLDRLCDLMSLYSQYVNDVQNLKETEVGLVKRRMIFKQY